MENRIKEQQPGLFAGQTSCHAFDANQFRLLLSGFAYILMERFLALLLKGTKFARATCGTIRLNFIRVGAVV
ncbi:MAG: transposase, partial [Lentisphaeria bacterium]|nr:transposase [Lentisphaeria bacterium]